MSHIERSALVHYSAQEMYRLVNDVGSYAEFLPWCRSSRVLEESETAMTGSIEIAKGVLNQTFTTSNRLIPGERIEIGLVDGPFRVLKGYWHFESLSGDDACRVTLVLDFEFDSAMMSIAAGPIFKKIANSLVDSFCKRAVDVYGMRG